jgi:outer membrane protein OmpA-like peptidoglycan-associated protein
MKKILINGIVGLLAVSAFAGNPDRRGEAGALELNMNGYGRTAGLWGLNCASVQGLEAERLNPAGVAFTKRTEILANYTSWLTGSGLSLIQAGVSQRIKGNAIAVSINAVNIGSIEKTTVNSPEGGIGQFKPTFFNIGLSYGKNFALGSTALTGGNVISGGVTVRLVTEGISNISATGFSFDAGLQYTTGKKENIHFGVSLRNIGTSMKLKGDGFAIDGATDGGYSLQVDRKSAKYELPIQLNIGASYDIYFGNKIEIAPKKYTQNFRLTPMAQFTANAYGNDQYGAGLEFAFKEIFMLRAAYRMENGIFKTETRKTAYNGLAAGMSVNVPFKKDGTGSSLGIDYAYRMTGLNTHFTGSHTVGIRFNLGGTPKEKEKDAEKAASKSAMQEEEVATVAKTSKKGKKKAEVELVEKQQLVDSLLKVNADLKVKAETPIVKIDTVQVTKTEIVIQKDTILVPTTYEKTDYKGGDVDTVVVDGKTQLKFNDYDLVQFETGSAVIQKKSYPYLNYLINIMKKNPSYKLSLAGHTDNVGDRDKNVKLSQDRVDAVKAYVTSKGVNGSKVSTSAFGPDKPKYKNDSEAGRAKNRRVEVNMEY